MKEKSTIHNSVRRRLRRTEKNVGYCNGQKTRELEEINRRFDASKDWPRPVILMLREVHGYQREFQASMYGRTSDKEAIFQTEHWGAMADAYRELLEKILLQARPYVIDEIKQMGAEMMELFAKEDASIVAMTDFTSRQKAMNEIDYRLDDDAWSRGALTLEACYAEDPEIAFLFRSLFKKRKDQFARWLALDGPMLGSVRKALRDGDKETLLKEMRGEYGDVFVRRLFGLSRRIDMGNAEERTKDMIPYAPTPNRFFLQMLEAADLKENDVFYDLGCGCGVVTALTALLSKAKVKGVEFDPAYARKAEEVAKLVNAHVEIMNQDVKEADLSDGTVFYLFNPFVGETLKTAMGKIREAARTKKVRVFSLNTDYEWSRQRDFRNMGQYGMVDVFEIGPTERIAPIDKRRK